MQDLEQTIRERAYHLWLADGARDGNADAYWLIAQREMLSASLASMGRVTVSADAAADASKKPPRKSKAMAPAKARRRAA